jgi:hypothetical protein
MAGTAPSLGGNSRSIIWRQPWNLNLSRFPGSRGEKGTAMSSEESSSNRKLSEHEVIIDVRLLIALIFGSYAFGAALEYLVLR